MVSTISLCMITKNEEKFIEQCLNSVKDIVDEIIIVDTGSTDNTIQIAKNFGANIKIFRFNWVDDFSAARNESLKYATKDWILVLDTDEIIEEKDCEKIKKVMENTENAGFKLEQRSYINNFFEGAIKNDSNFELIKKYPFYISNSLVRLFKNNMGLKFHHRVHELVEDSIKEKNLKYGNTDITLHHFGSLKEETKINEKTEQYTKLIFKQLEDNPNSARYNYQAARMFLGKEDLTSALAYFKKTAELDKSYKLVFSEIAKIYLQLNNYNKAIQYFKKGLQQNPDDLSAPNNLAVVYMAKGEFEKAKAILEEYLKKAPENRALRYNYEKVLENLK